MEHIYNNLYTFARFFCNLRKLLFSMPLTYSHFSEEQNVNHVGKQ